MVRRTIYGTGDMFGDGNGPTYDWRRQPSSIWLKSVVNWTHNIIFSDVQSGFPAETVVQKVPALQQYEAENNI